MKDRLARILASSLIVLLLVLGSGANLLHNHSDGDCHDDCPACTWLVHTVYVLTFFLLLFGVIYPLFFGKIAARRPIHITSFCRASQRLRSPPLPS